MFKFYFFRLTALVLLLGPSASAQELVPLANWRERLTDNVPTSGLLVAGVHWAAPANKDPRKFSTDSLSLPLPKSLQPGNVCIRVATKDGRYRGLASFDTPPNPTGTSRVSFKSAYKTILEDIPELDFAVRATVGPDCDDSSRATIVPVSIGSGVSTTSLAILLNPVDATASVRFLQPNGRVISDTLAACQSAGAGTRIAYSQVCYVQITDGSFSGTATMEVTLERLIGTRSIVKYPVEILSRTR